MGRKHGLRVCGLIMIFALIFHINVHAEHTKDWLTEEEQIWLEAHPVITYAFDPEFAPFEFYGDKNKAEGISIEVLELLEDQLGIDMKIERVGPWSAVIEALMNEDIDMISAAPTAERRERMYFSNSYLSIPTGMIIREGNTAIESMEDLSGKRISTVRGWSWNEILKEEHPEYKIFVYENVEDALNAVVYGDVDATLQDFGTASYHISLNKITTLKLLAKYDHSQDIAFAVKEDYRPLINIVNKTIPRIEPEIREIHDKWIKLDYEDIGSNSLLLRIVGLISGILIVMLLWTFSLKTQVDKKTKALKIELEKTEQLKSEMETMNNRIVQSERELRAILDADPSSIFVKDRQGRFTIVNKAAARTIGTSPDQMIGKRMEDFPDRIDPETLENIWTLEKRIFNGEQDFETYTVEVNGGAGTRHIHVVRKLPILGAGRQVEFVLSVASDITELHDKNEALENSLSDLKEAKTQLLEQERWAAIGAFVAGIAHDVNTPLGSSITINSHLRKVLQDSKGALEQGTLKKSDLLEFYSDVDETTSMLDRHLHQAADLIQNFKAVSVHQINEIEESFDICAYINRIALGMKYECKMKGVTMDVACGESITYQGTPGLISQILTNLIANSLKHGFENRTSGLIKIDAKSVDKGVQIIYSDDGVGMTEEILEKAFVPFYTTKREEGGSGLGMHIVHTLVTEKLGGTISVTSQPGKGVAFDIYLPN